VSLWATVLSFSGYESRSCKLQAEEAPLLTIRLCMADPRTLVVLGLLVMRRWPERGLHLQRGTR